MSVPAHKLLAHRVRVRAQWHREHVVRCIRPARFLVGRADQAALLAVLDLPLVVLVLASRHDLDLVLDRVDLVARLA